MTIAPFARYRASLQELDPERGLSLAFWVYFPWFYERHSRLTSEGLDFDELYTISSSFVEGTPLAHRLWVFGQMKDRCGDNLSRWCRYHRVVFEGGMQELAGREINRLLEQGSRRELQLALSLLKPGTAFFNTVLARCRKDVGLD